MIKYIIIASLDAMKIQAKKILNQSSAGRVPDLMVQDCDGRVVLDKTTRMTNVDGRLSLVSCQHPHLDVGTSEFVNGFWYTFLELILNGGGATKIEVSFYDLACVLDHLTLARQGIGIRIANVQVPYGLRREQVTVGLAYESRVVGTFPMLVRGTPPILGRPIDIEKLGLEKLGLAKLERSCCSLRLRIASCASRLLRMLLPCKSRRHVRRGSEQLMVHAIGKGLDGQGSRFSIDGQMPGSLFRHPPVSQASIFLCEQREWLSLYVANHCLRGRLAHRLLALALTTSFLVNKHFGFVLPILQIDVMQPGRTRDTEFAKLHHVFFVDGGCPRLKRGIIVLNMMMKLVKIGKKATLALIRYHELTSVSLRQT
ncbi:hypothetical protein KCU61_g96, partial [Aureobasidium melanogenum]